MDHFDVLRDAVAARGGTIVKTIGDAVMAAFLRPAAAIETTLAAQKALDSEPTAGVPILLKAGIHYGPCIAVTLNDHLDYFGSSVNIASRLEGLSDGGDIIVSSAVRDDPDVEALIQEPDKGLCVERLQGTLRGLEAEDITTWRIRVAGPPPV
jgi:class 3 adenylate cyclase